MTGSNPSRKALLLLRQRAKVALDLHAVPELRRLVEEGAKADGHDGRDRPMPEHNLVDRTGSHADGAGHGVLGNPHRREVFLQQDFTGSDGRVPGHNA